MTARSWRDVATFSSGFEADVAGKLIHGPGWMGHRVQAASSPKRLEGGAWVGLVRQEVHRFEYARLSGIIDAHE